MGLGKVIGRAISGFAEGASDAYARHAEFDLQRKRDEALAALQREQTDYAFGKDMQLAQAKASMQGPEYSNEMKRAMELSGQGPRHPDTIKFLNAQVFKPEVVTDQGYGFRVIPTDPVGLADATNNPPPVQQDIPTFSSPTEAAESGLPPGTKFKSPNGAIYEIPGGASSDAGGGFRY